MNAFASGARSRRSELLLSVTVLSLSALGGALAPGAAQAQDAAPSPPPAAQPASSQEENADYGTRVRELVVTGTRGASAIAPNKASLEATEPQTIVTRDAIDQFVPQTGDFTQVVLLSPSISGISFNGPGLYETKTTLRGFKDGEYTVTYDGIPFGDTNDPTHHSTTFFPGATIGAAVVDRGPGAAGQLGQANFGGSINLFSPEVSTTRGLQETVTNGSWNTWQSVTKINTGSIDQLNGTRLLLNFQELSTDGYLSYSNATAANQMARAVIPLMGDWQLTLYGVYNLTHIHQDDNNGATLGQVALYGKDFALNNDPTTPQYWGYNSVKKKTAFTYARLNGSLWQGASLEDTAYMYYYSNHTYSALDVTGATPLGTKAAPKGNLDVPGYTKLNYYHVYGDILRVTQQTPYGDLRAGLWLETSDTHRSRYDYDFTLNVADPREKTAPLNISYDQHSSWDQYQPFVDFEWRPVPNLTITPGIKYVHFERDVTGPVAQGPRNNVSESATYEKTLYFLTANYKLRPNWSVYAQTATGMLVPALSVLQVSAADTSNFQPQTSTNYQLGTVFHGPKVTFDADVYYIDFNNKQQSLTCPSGGTPSCPANETEYFNLGGAVYKGVEGQLTYQFTPIVYGFVNGSINDAKTKGVNDPTTGIVVVGGKQIANAPVGTAAIGAILRQGPWEATIADKYVGHQWAAEGEPASERISPYSQTDLTIVYRFGRYRIEAAGYNIFNSQKTAKVTPGKTAPFDQYYFQPEANYQISLRASF